MDEIALKKRNRNSSRDHILHLSKAAKRFKLASVEKRTDRATRYGLADVSNTFNGTHSSAEGSYNSSQEIHKKTKIPLKQKDESYKITKITSSSGKERDCTVSGSEDYTGHLPSRRPVKSPRLGPRRYINTTRVLEPLKKRKLPASPELVPLNDSSEESDSSEDVGQGSSFSTDYGHDGACEHFSQDTNYSYDPRGTRSVDSDDLISQQASQEDTEEGTQGDVHTSMDDGCEDEYPSIELARKDPVDFYEYTELPGLQEITKGLLDQSVCDEEELFRNYYFDDDVPAVDPYFNSTLLDKTGAKHIKDIPDIYDFSAIQESFEPIALDTHESQLQDSLELYRQKGVPTFQNDDSIYQDDCLVAKAARYQQTIEKTPLGKSGPCATSSPRRPLKCVRFSHQKEGKLLPKNSTFLISQKGKHNENEVNENSAKLADCEMAAKSDGAGFDQPPSAASRVLVQEPCSVPEELKSKYPPGILKATRFRIKRTTSTPVNPRKHHSFDSVDIDMSEVHPSSSELEFPGHQSLCTVNSEEIHVTDPLLELELETMHSPKLSYVNLEELSGASSPAGNNENEPAKKARKICSLV